MASDFKDEETPAFRGPREPLDAIAEDQKRLVSNLVDLSLALDVAEKNSKARSHEIATALTVLKGLVLTLISDARKGKSDIVGHAKVYLGPERRAKPRKDKDEVTDKFNLPVGLGHLQLARVASRRILGWFVGGCLMVGSHLIHWFLTRR